jgi:acetyltransferase-like isoleucine patch superfamily enzyme
MIAGMIAPIEQRLRAFGEPLAAPSPDPAGLEICRAELPAWWSDRNNILLCPPQARIPTIREHPGAEPPSNALVVMQEGSILENLFLWGDAAIVSIGKGASLRNGTIGCGGPAVVIIGNNVSAGHPDIQARNGGLVSIAGDGLWSAGVRAFSDDMHAIRDVNTGKRLNAFGGRVIVGAHVWIGYEALLLPGARIEHGSIVGARSVVKTHIPAHASCAGNPARVVKTGVEWRLEDAP